MLDEENVLHQHNFVSTGKFPFCLNESFFNYIFFILQIENHISDIDNWKGMFIFFFVRALKSIV